MITIWGGLNQFGRRYAWVDSVPVFVNMRVQEAFRINPDALKTFSANLNFLLFLRFLVSLLFCAVEVRPAFFSSDHMCPTDTFTANIRLNYRNFNLSSKHPGRKRRRGLLFLPIIAGIMQINAIYFEAKWDKIYRM